MQVQPAQAPKVSSSHVGAFLLIAIGALMLIANLSGGGNLAGGLVVLAIGAAFAAAYALSRKYGFLVPGGILSGLGAGVLIGELANASENDLGIYAVLGLGTGFLLVYAVDALVTGSARRFWPLIPGGVMMLVAGGLATNNQGFLNTLGTWSPIVLVLIGLWLLFMRGRAAKA